MYGTLRTALGILAAAFIHVSTPAPVLAQAPDATRGELTVTVSDSTGARVADAVVTLTRGAERHRSTTGEDGIARFPNLAAAEWIVVVTRDGFAPWSQPVRISSSVVDLPVGLAVAGLLESVQVEGEAGPPTPIPLNAPAPGGSLLDIPVRDLPASLYLVSQPLIQERGARTVEEAVQLAVGMQASTGVGSIPGYSTRGWSGNNISLMRDGVRQNSNSQSSRPVDAFLLDRIEILKGPASLLYGEGAIGGAVNMVSKSPFAQVGVDSLLAYGSYGQYRAGVGINVPLRNNLFARVDVSQSGSDGYVGNSPQKLVAGAASVRWLPTSNVSIKGSGHYTYDNTSSYYSTPFINGEFDPRTRDINYNMEDRLTKSHNKWAQVEGDVLLGGGWKLHDQFFAATHALDWRNFEGYSYNAASNTVDVSSYFLIWRSDLLLGNRADVRNTFNLGGRSLGFMAGAETQRNDMERAGNPTPNFVVPVRKLDPFNPAPHFDPGLEYVRQRDVLIKTRALFAESVLDATQRLKIVSGVRWEQIDLAYTPYPSLVTASQTYEPATGRVGAVFELTASANVYGSYSRAVEPTTQLVSLDGSQQRFSLVPGSQFEVGAKGGVLDGRLEGTFAYFAIEKRDLLITQLIWFVSGIVFVYVGMPTLPAEERLRRMEPLDLTSLRVAPGEAAARAGLESPTRVRIAMHDGRPVYRLQSGPDWRMVYADTGAPLDGMGVDEAMALMRRFVPEHASTLRYERRLTDSDQWTLQNIIRTNMPMHRIALDDEAGTEYYVSEKTGEPVLRTTSSGRFWGYLGAVLHWLYFTPLRRHGAFWNSFVVWSSLIGTVMVFLGMAIGVWRYSLSGRFRLRGARSHTPYATWMKWHHYTGLFFGFFAAMWAFSGALSLGPFDSLRPGPPSRAFREAATGGPIVLEPLTIDRIRAVASAVQRSFTPKELDFFQFEGEPYFIAYVPPSPSESAPWRNSDIAAATSLHIDRKYVLVSAFRPDAGLFTTFDKERMWDVARRAMPGVPMEDAVWLNEYDTYYYSQTGIRPLPVLRIRYLDPPRTWLYLDPARGVIASRLERGSRWNRWLYHGFHSLDFPFMYYKRPLWDIVVIVLSLGGIAISVTSGLPAWRRLVRHGKRATDWLMPGGRPRLPAFNLARIWLPSRMPGREGAERGGR